MANVTNRVPLLRDPVSIVDVFSAADLPDPVTAPDGVMRSPLALDTEYRIQETFLWPPLLVPALTNFLGAQVTSIVGANQSINMLWDGAGSNTPQIWGRNTPFFLLRDLTIIDFANGGVGRGTVLVDLVGGGPLAVLSVDFSAFINFASLGKVVDAALLWTAVPLVGNKAGIAVIQSGDVDLLQTLSSLLVLQDQINPLPALKSAYFFKCLGGGTTAIAAGSIGQNAGDEFLCLDSAADGGFQITALSYAGASAGEFFAADLSLALTAMVSVDKAIASFAADAKAVVSVAAGTSGSNFSTGSVRHQWAVGDTVTGSGFATGAYNVVQTITALPDPFTYQVGALAFVVDDSGTATDDLATVCGSADAGFTVGQIILISGASAAFNGLRQIKSVAVDENSFVIPVDFATGSDGTGVIEITRITTASANPLHIGETHTISGTTSYNGIRAVLFTPSDTTFDISAAFVANDATGLVVATSRDQRSIGLFVRSCGAQPDSKCIGSMHVNGNAAATVISVINTWTNLNLNAAAVVSGNIERWSLQNTTTGELRLDGDAPFSGVASVSISGSGFASNHDYEFRVVVNGNPTSDAIVSATSTNSSIRNIGLVVPLALVQNDLVRVQVQNTDGTDNFTVQQLSINIQ